MRNSVLVAVAIAILLGAGGPLRAQPQAEGYTLDDIYYFLAEGTEATWGAHSLEPQSGAPGEDIEGFNKSLEDIYYFMAEAFGQCTLKPEDLTVDVTYNDLVGKVFFSTQTDSWGLYEIPEPWELNETTCNELAGWSWINGACWSQAIADSVSWNKGVGNDTSTTGAYEPNTAGTLKSRMEAAVAGRWSEICTSINGRAITSGDDGSAGKPYISALAIADCVDGARDLGPTISGSDWQSRSNTIKAWATAAGKSALPAVDYNGSNNEFEAACSGDFYLNTSTLAPGTNFCWGAACGYTIDGYWDTYARSLGYNSCSNQGYYVTSNTNDYASFRVVVRPPAE